MLVMDSQVDGSALRAQSYSDRRTTGVSLRIVEDLIVAAANDARGKVEAMVQQQMKSITGGLPLPPGFKL